jgi:hypothetical protein
MLLVESATLVVSMLLLGVLWRLSQDIRAIREGALTKIYQALVQQQFAEGRFSFWDQRDNHEDPTSHEYLGTSRHGCFVVWVWRNGEWKTRTTPAGIPATSPPPYPGAFSGDLAKTWVAFQRQ